jgi:hypothetical protein
MAGRIDGASSADDSKYEAVNVGDKRKERDGIRTAGNDAT